MHTSILSQTQRQVKQLFDDIDTSHLYYHNYQHTVAVVQQIQVLAKHSNLNPTTINLLSIAGWFHDTGYLYNYHNHEEGSMKIAQDYLQQQGLKQQSIQIVVDCIEATKLTAEPRNHLEEIIKDAEFNIKTDMVIKSLGFDPENLQKLFNDSNLLLTKWGTIKVDFKTMETNKTGVFAAGDIVRGASLVVWAIKDGRDVAISIKNYLQNKEKKKSK